MFTADILKQENLGVQLIVTRLFRVYYKNLIQSMTNLVLCDKTHRDQQTENCSTYEAIYISHFDLPN